MAWMTTKLTLAKDPNHINTKTGTPMATGYGFAKLKSNDTPDLGLGIVAFGSVAEALLNHQKGQTIQISGDLEIRVYQNREGQQVEQLQMTIDTLASATQNRPARRGDSQRQGNQNNQQGYGQQQPMQSPPPNQPNQYQNDMGFQQRPNQPTTQMGQPMSANQFDDDDINF